MATTTTIVSGGESKGNKPVSIMLIVFGALGLIFAIVSIIYSGVGANLALEGSGVEALQATCMTSWDAISFSDGGRCEMDDTELAANNALWGLPDEQMMCNLKPEVSACNYDHHKAGFQVATGIGLAATIAGAFFVIIASIPVLINGVFGFQNKEVAAKVSGGFGVGCSVPGVIGAGICTIVLLIGVGGATIADGIIRLEYNNVDYLNEPCTSACETSIKATMELGQHLIDYYGALTWLMLIMVILALIESILACVSCCFWKKQAVVVTTTVTPGVVAAPVVAAEPVVVKTEGN